MNLKFKIQSRFNRDQNSIIWKLIENWKLPALSEAEGKIGNSSQGGYIAISMILILSAVILGIIVTVARLGIGEGQVSLALSKGENALHFVEGCMEDVLLRIRENPSYSASSIIYPEGTCSVTISPAGSVYTITTSNSDISYKRTIQVVATRGTSMTLDSWKEL